MPATPTHTTGMPHSRAFSANRIGNRPGGEADHPGVGRHALRHPGLGRDDRPVGDVDVVGDPGLPGYHDVVPGAGGSRDADLGGDDVVPPDLAVVGDHHEVVDLGAGP